MACPSTTPLHTELRGLLYLSTALPSSSSGISLRSLSIPLLNAMCPSDSRIEETSPEGSIGVSDRAEPGALHSLLQDKTPFRVCSLRVGGTAVEDSFDVGDGEIGVCRGDIVA